MDDKLDLEAAVPATIAPSIVNKPSRSKANLVGLIILLGVFCVGITISAFILLAISADASTPSSGAKGLLSIMVSLAMIVVAPITLVSLFFAAVLIVNLRLPYDIGMRSIKDIKMYTTRLIIAGLVSMFGAAGSVLLSLLCLGASSSLYGLFLSFSAFAFIPLAVLCLVWGFIYLIRAHYTNSLILSFDNNSNGEIP